MNFDTLIFDLDGTLAETRQDITNATNYVRLRHNLEPLSLERISGFVGDGIAKLLERALPGFSANELKQSSEIFTEYYTVHLLDNTYLYTGVKEFLETHKHLHLVVLSNKAQSFTDKIIDKLSLRSFFQIVLGGTEYLPRKPAPDAINFILRKLNVTKETALMIGDTKNDILAGQAAGAKTCAVSYGFRLREELLPYKPDFLIDSIEELAAILRS